MTLQFDDTLTSAHRSLRDVVASGVYRRGLKAVAADLDLSPGNLSSAMGDESQRKFGVDELERYIQATGDKAPVYYLVAKYLGDEAAARDQALAQVADMMHHLPAMLAALGVQDGQKAAASKGRAR